MSDSLDKFNEIISKIEKDKASKKKIIEEELPKHNPQKHGNISLISASGIAVTETGEVTRSDFFKDLDLYNDTYSTIMLTKEEAQSLRNAMRFTSTGVNSQLPMQCIGKECPFAKGCWFVENERSPIGKPCPIEAQLLNYYTKQFCKEFDVQPEDFSELMLIQELSELIVYEMRATKVLSKPENAALSGRTTKFSPDGIPIEEEVEHWAFSLKEKIKNRRLKILDALNATRKAKLQIARQMDKGQDEEEKKQNIVGEVLSVIRTLKKETPYEEVK